MLDGVNRKLRLL